jgi:hypothetical protein
MFILFRNIIASLFFWTNRLFLFQLPRTARTPAFRVPGASFRRWNSTEGEKVKGQVIGIDLGMLFWQSSHSRFSF